MKGFLIIFCIVLTMHINTITADEIPETAPDDTVHTVADNPADLDLDDLKYELDSEGDSQVPQVLIPRDKENDFVRLPNDLGEFEVVSRTEVEKSRRNASVYDAAKYTKFLLYNRANDEPVEFKLDEMHTLPERFGFNTQRPTMYLIHGWFGDLDSKVMVPMAKELLKTDDLNIIAVNWKEGSHVGYALARYRVRYVAALVAATINRLIDEIGQSPEQIGLVGHSLGAHVAGLAGKKTTQKIAFIIGLDAASPLFRYKKVEDRLAADDALFVEAIHTNAKCLGFYRNITQVDFYPNGGTRQPGCKGSIMCDHVRAVLYYMESINVQNLYARKCPDVTALSNRCDLGETFLGGYELSKLQTKPQGVYYLSTASEQPFLRFLS